MAIRSGGIMRDTCMHIMFPGSRYIDPEPPEYCDEPAIEGSEFCEIHQEES